MSSLVVQDPWVTRLMLAWTLTIVLVPFPTALVAEAGSERGYYPLLLLLLTDPITIALRRGRGDRRRPTHMGE